MKRTRTLTVTATLVTVGVAFYAYLVFREASKPRPLFHDSWKIAGGDIVPRWHLLQPHFAGENVILADPRINLLAVINVSAIDNGLGLLDFKFNPDSATVAVVGQMSARVTKQSDSLVLVNSRGEIRTLEIEPGIAQKMYIDAKRLDPQQTISMIEEISRP